MCERDSAEYVDRVLFQVPVFDLTTRKWSRKSTIPDPEHGYPLARRCHSVVRSNCGNWTVVAGGIGDDRCFDDIWKLYLPEMRWMRLEQSLPEKVFFHSSSISSVSRKAGARCTHSERQCFAAIISTVSLLAE